MLPGAARLSRELKIMVHTTVGTSGTDVQRNVMRIHALFLTHLRLYCVVLYSEGIRTLSPDCSSVPIIG